MALLRGRARDGVLDMPPDVHDSKEPDIVGLPPALPAVTRGSEKRMSNPNATENHYSQVILHARHPPRHQVEMDADAKTNHLA
jgi:hypothetical protein